MTCRKVASWNGRSPAGRFAGVDSAGVPFYSDTLGRYATEEECKSACGEGACCDGTTCSIKPQCQCQGAGKTFKGVGTTCSDTVGFCCGADSWVDLESVYWYIPVNGSPEPRSVVLSPPQKLPMRTIDAHRQQCELHGGTWVTQPCVFPVSGVPVAQKSGLGGDINVCYPKPNPLP